MNRSTVLGHGISKGWEEKGMCSNDDEDKSDTAAMPCDLGKESGRGWRTCVMRTACWEQVSK